MNVDDINVDLSLMEGIDGWSLDMWVIVELMNCFVYVVCVSGLIDWLYFFFISFEFGLMGYYIKDGFLSI